MEATVKIRLNSWCKGRANLQFIERYIGIVSATIYKPKAKSRSKVQAQVKSKKGKRNLGLGIPEEVSQVKVDSKGQQHKVVQRDQVEYYEGHFK